MKRSEYIKSGLTLAAAFFLAAGAEGWVTVLLDLLGSLV